MRLIALLLTMMLSGCDQFSQKSPDLEAGVNASLMVVQTSDKCPTGLRPCLVAATKDDIQPLLQEGPGNNQDEAENGGEETGAGARLFGEPKQTYSPNDYFSDEEITSTCNDVNFAESMPLFNYRGYFGRQVKARASNAARLLVPSEYDRLPDYYADIYFAVVRTSPRIFLKVAEGAFLGPYDEFPWRPERIDDAIRRVIQWYARHCVYLTFHRVNVPGLQAEGAELLVYKAWLESIKNTPVGFTIPTARGNRGVSVIADIEEATRAVVEARPGVTGSPLTVLFMDRVVDLNTRGATGARLTEASLAISNRNTIAMHGYDANDPYVLAHELIHALGRPSARRPRPGPNSWFHSGNEQAMSRIVRNRLNNPSGLTAARLWDFAEYEDATASGQLRNDQ